MKRDEQHIWVVFGLPESVGCSVCKISANQSVLTYIAKNSNDRKLRMVALKWLNDQSVLIDIMSSSDKHKYVFRNPIYDSVNTSHHHGGGMIDLREVAFKRLSELIGHEKAMEKLVELQGK
jgi:hypothetical protein